VIRLLIGDLFANVRVWIGAFVVVAAVALSTVFAVAVAQTGLNILTVEPAELVRLSRLDVPADSADAVASAFVTVFVIIAGFVVLFDAVVSIAVLGSTIRLTVSMQRRNHAMWQIVGVQPRTAVAIVRWQLVIVAAVAACAGTGLGAVVVVPLLDLGLGAFGQLPRVPVSFTGGGAATTIGFVVAIAWLGALRPSRRVGQVDAIEALRGPDAAESRMTIARWALAAVVAALAVTTLASLGSAGADDVGPVALSAVLFLVVFVVAVSPAVVPWLTRTWTAIVPASASSSWYLARRTAEYDLGRSASTVLSVMLAVTVPTGIWSAISMAGSVTGGDEDSGIGAFALVLAGPLLISLVGAAASAFMSSGARDRELALLRSAGGTDRVVVRTALWEAVVHVGTALLLAAAVIVVLALSTWAALLGAYPDVRLDLGASMAGPIAGAALVMLTVATIVPTLWSVRRRLVSYLVES
jgi:putative ABC transport system permease protein